MKTYYPTINLLRGLAAFLVCIFHFVGYQDFRFDLFSPDSVITQLGQFGVNGVFIFFVISGFVIPLSLSSSGFKLTHLHRFLFKRFVRIEIPYIVSIALILLVALLFALKNNTPFHFNFQQFFYHLIYYIPFSGFEWYNVIYWTLAIEFQFYIVIGLLYYIFSSKNQFVITATLILFGASNFICNDNRLVFNYAVIFLQGIVLYLIKTERLNHVTGLILLLACLIATGWLHSFEISIFTALTVLCIHSVEVENKFTKRFGEISYSLYLTHGLIGSNLIYILGRFADSNTAKITLAVVALFVSFVFAYLYWLLIENPSKQLSKKLG